MHRPLLKRTSPWLGTGGGGWANQFISGFLLIGPVSEEGVYLLEERDPRPISESDVLGGASERCRFRTSSRKSPRDLELWGEGLVQVEGGLLVGPYVPSRDVVLTRQGEVPRRNTLFRFGVPQGEKLSSVGDLKQSPTSRVAFGSNSYRHPCTWSSFLLD